MASPEQTRGQEFNERILGMEKAVVLQVSKADKFVAERLSCVLRLPKAKRLSMN